jgi:hypothetical protein
MIDRGPDGVLLWRPFTLQFLAQDADDRPFAGQCCLAIANIDDQIESPGADDIALSSHAWHCHGPKLRFRPRLAATGFPFLEALRPSRD